MNLFWPAATSAKARWYRAGILVSFALIVIAAFSGLLFMHAAWAESHAKAHLRVTDILVKYGGYETNEMYVGEAVAYCAEPSKATPKQGSYAKKALKPKKSSSGNSHNKQTIAAALWFGWGGPGFDKDMWPKTWYDGSGMNAHKYWAISHIVLSDFYTASHQDALYGCSEEFSNWAQGTVLSYKSAQKPYVTSAAQSKIRERAAEVPQEFVNACYQLGTGDGYQVILSFESGGWIDLDKDSANANITSLNKSYSLKGARYGLYQSVKDAQEDTHRIQTLITDEKGYAKSSYLVKDSYYLKEVSAPSGYECDEQVYAVNVQHNATTRVNKDHVYEVPATDTPELIIEKVDAQTGASNAQGSASLAGAEFTIEYYDKLFSTKEAAQKSGNPVKTWVFKTNDQGKISLQDASQLVSGELYHDANGTAVLPLGTYLVYETKAPQGYLKNTQTVLRQVTQTTGLSRVASAAHTTETTDAINPTALTDAAKSAEGSSLTGSHALADAAGPAEVSALAGSSGSAGVSGSARGSFSPLAHKSAVSEQVIAGGVSFEKLDAETKTNHPLGGGSLNAIFEITNASANPVVVQGQTYQPGQVVYTGQAKKDEAGGYYFTTDVDHDERDATLPYGTYYLTEKLPGTGYEASSQKVEFSISQPNKVVAIQADKTFTNQIKRGDLEFVKARESDMARLGHVPFKITSETTGESHILLTDENGYASSQASWNKHSAYTNANDFLLTQIDDANDESSSNESSSNNTEDHDEDAKNNSNEDTSNSEEDGKNGNAEAGIWFGQMNGQSLTTPNDELGALPYDTYTIEELRCSANQGLELITLNGVVIKRDKTTIHLGTIDNRDALQPYLYTSASNNNQVGRTLPVHTQTLAIDQVEYGGLVPDQEYTITSHVYDNTAQELLPNTETSLTFTPQKTTGTVTMNIPVNTSNLAGHSLTVFEQLTTQGQTVVEHHNPQNTDQGLIVAKPNISTKARDITDGDQELIADANCAVTDTVFYEQLIPHQTYRLKGALVNKKTGQEIAQAQATFTPEEAQGSTQVNFSFNGFEVCGEEEGVSLVACETLLLNDTELCVHHDLEDMNQTVEVRKPVLEIPPEEPPVIPEPTPEDPIPPETPPADTAVPTGDATKPMLLALICGGSLLVALVVRRYMTIISRKEAIMDRIGG